MKKIPIFLLTAMVFLNSCFIDGKRVKGNGHIITENRSLGDVAGVELHSSFDVYLSEGSPAGVRIEAEENIISYIDLRVENGILNIETKDHVWFRSHKPVKIFVTNPGYNTIQLTSSGSITGQTKISSDTKLDIDLTGSGDLKLDVDAPEINASVSGSGGMDLSGETKKIRADVTGSGDIKAMNLKSEEADLQISGSGGIDAYASIKLEANISGSGDIRYKGDARVTRNTSGSGEVRKVD